MGSWIERHIFLSMLLLLAAVALMTAFWPVILAAAILGSLGWVLWGCTRAYDEHHLARARHDSMLSAHADYEHHLWMMGDPRGFYGMFPPRN